MKKEVKVNQIMNPIYESLKMKYSVLNGFSKEEKKWIEQEAMLEVQELKKIFGVKDALLYSYQLQNLEIDLISKEKKLWRLFIFSHFVFLFGRRVILIDSTMLKLICDSVTIENLKKELRYLELLTDYRLMIKILEHAMYVDFSSSLTSCYKLDMERVKRVFFFLCRRIEKYLETINEEIDMVELKELVLKHVKTYESKQLFKRSVTI